MSKFEFETIRFSCICRSFMEGEHGYGDAMPMGMALRSLSVSLKEKDVSDARTSVYSGTRNKKREQARIRKNRVRKECGVRNVAFITPPR